MTVAQIAAWLRSQPFSVWEQVRPCLESDRRQGVRDLARRCKAWLQEAQVLRDTYERRLVFEREAWAKGYRLVAGVDEAGRGPLAGPVVAAAVILDPSAFIPGLDDSKRLTPPRREMLAAEIREKAVAWSVAVVDVEVIDRINVANAAFLAMRQAIDQLAVPPDFLLVDGFAIPGLGCPQRGITGGDGLSNSIAAASILAKVRRDALMVEYGKAYPGYGFEIHKGYPTKEHKEALMRLGLSPIHRRSFCDMARFHQGDSANRRFGQKAEELACSYLRGKGYVILYKNFRCRVGEIDIIAQEGGTLVFLEVKARRRDAFGAPEEAVNCAKRRRITLAARYFLSQTGLEDHPCRFDVVSMVFDGQRDPDIVLIQDAFRPVLRS